MQNIKQVCKELGSILLLPTEESLCVLLESLDDSLWLNLGLRLPAPHLLDQVSIPLGDVAT